MFRAKANMLSLEQKQYIYIMFTAKTIYIMFRA